MWTFLGVISRGQKKIATFCSKAIEIEIAEGLEGSN